VVTIVDIVDRMFGLIDEQFKDQKDFAKAIDADPSHISRWRNRKTTSFQRRLPKIAEVLNTTTEYLLTGEGPKTKAPASESGEGAVKPEHLRAAFFEGADDLSKEEMDELWDDARDYMRYKLEQRRKQKHE